MKPDELAKHKVLSKVLLKLNEEYHRYLYITSFNNLEDERRRVREQFN